MQASKCPSIDQASEPFAARLVAPTELVPDAGLFQGIPGRIRSGAVCMNALELTRPYAPAYRHHEISKERCDGND